MVQDLNSNLSFLAYFGEYVSPKGTKLKKAIYSCSCGGFLVAIESNVNKGNTKSCGCHKENITRKVLIENIRGMGETHGMHGTPIYKIWNNLIQRCHNPVATGYENYGGRGIKVCDRWLESFENFYEDMGNVSNEMSLDRIDVNLGYCLENCRWATRSEQNFNKRQQSNNSSGKTGVCWNKRNNKWEVELRMDGKRLRLGLYEDFELAVFVREEAELKYYGYLRDNNGKKENK